MVGINSTYSVRFGYDCHKVAKQWMVLYSSSQKPQTTCYLIGLDFQPKLGFRLVMETPEMFVDLLTGEEHQHKNKDQSTTGPPLCEEETRTIQTPEGAIWERPQPKNSPPHPLPFPPVDKK